MATHSPQSRVVASRVKAENKQGGAGVRSCNAILLKKSYSKNQEKKFRSQMLYNARSELG